MRRLPMMTSQYIFCVLFVLICISISSATASQYGGLPFVGGGYNTAESTQIISKTGKDRIDKRFSEINYEH